MKADRKTVKRRLWNLGVIWVALLSGQCVGVVIPSIWIGIPCALILAILITQLGWKEKP